MKIEIKNLSKKYTEKIALNDLTLELEENKIYGLLGRNGAGKTTLMQLLAGYMLPTSGSIKVNGQSPFDNRDVLKDICLINESNNFMNRLKVKDILKIASLFYPNWSNEKAERLLETFNLKGKMSVKGLSKGMESALGIIIGLASRTKIAIFDEPYIGLDASARYKFYDALLEEYEEYPRTIILSTHLIDEVSNLFEEVILIKNGELLFHRTTEELLELTLKVSGSKHAVNSFIEGKEVIHEAELAGQKAATLFGERYDKREAISLGLTIESVTIQHLMVYLTEETQGGKLHA
ncbi:ABC transporter ATP-binding protein [Anaerobacillus alkaliphilus]|uniref:ABC transporter ATP-binding protein n=1 Tax=Anaerobacillus alkaliphilus TaxID=1548597 RepID=A0A4Q0VMY1_9BACI|nr:ABC transporter ATP-binding protein [Anaerobacillus alkaliphilus]RXI96190.1 ABC transporter ATP-binding protein [Anaerobacillus alkaliphilus]